VNAHADAYNDRANADSQRQRAAEDAREHAEWEARRNKHNLDMIRRSLQLAGPNSTLLCYQKDWIESDEFQDQKADSDFRLVPVTVAGARISLAYPAQRIDGANCLDALFGIACPIVIANQIRANQQPLDEPYLAVCHVNSPSKSCRVTAGNLGDGPFSVECH
jgi:hypothetical protein